MCAAKCDRNSFLWTKSYSDCRHELGWQTLAQRRDILSCCQTYKMVNHLGCLAFENFLSIKLFGSVYLFENFLNVVWLLDTVLKLRVAIFIVCL